jgi:hypothetical protein
LAHLIDGMRLDSGYNEGVRRDNYGQPVQSAATGRVSQPVRVGSAIKEATSEPLAHERRLGLLRRWPVATGEVLSALILLGVGTACLAMLFGGTERGRASIANEATVGALPATTVGPWYSANEPSALPVHLFIIVVGEARAGDYRAYLVADALVRERIGEAPRDAEVLAVATQSEALTLDAVIADHSRIPGFGPVTTVVIQ